MTSPRRAIDRLWQCLCSTSSQSSQKGYYELLSTVARNRIGCQKLQRHQTHTQPSPTKPPDDLSQRPSPDLLEQRRLRNPRWKPIYLIGQEIRDQARIRDLDIASAYQELRRSAVKGNYSLTREIVSILVKERGQKPNLRLYDALLLANMDNQDGSAGEVARLLDEIAVEGLTPDSATYHAALKVGDQARVIKCSGLSPSRFLPYTQTIC